MLGSFKRKSRARETERFLAPLRERETEREGSEAPLRERESIYAPGRERERHRQMLGSFEEERDAYLFERKREGDATLLCQRERDGRLL